MGVLTRWTTITLARQSVPDCTTTVGNMTLASPGHFPDPGFGMFVRADGRRFGRGT
jgi:hypothetical protein